MIKKTDSLDAKAAALVQGAVLAALGEGEAADAAAAAITDGLLPAFGAAAIRRRIESDMMGAYKEGYLSGCLAGRYARWHAIIWRASQTFKRLKAPAAGEDKARFERYNF